MCLKMQNEKNSQKQPTIKFNKGEKDNMDNISIFSSSYGLSDLCITIKNLSKHRNSYGNLALFDYSTFKDIQLNFKIKCLI